MLKELKDNEICLYIHEYMFVYDLYKSNNRNYDITLEDLLDLWNQQEGICPYSGVKLVHPNEGGNNLNTASLDRIDSKVGYIKGNLQFISIMCNQAKNNLTHEEMLTFLKTISDFHNK
jgi:hypothetical protein